MSATIIDGTAYAEKIRTEVTEEVKQRVAAGKSVPGLATVLVGDDPASHVYVRSKHKACQAAGIASFSHELPANASQEEVEALVKQLNNNPARQRHFGAVAVAGVARRRAGAQRHQTRKRCGWIPPVNIGRLAQKGRTPLFVPCTPSGVMYLLEHTLPSLAGVNAVVLGRSNIVGMPVALLLVRANATVTLAHSHSKDLPGLVRQADVLVTAVGRPNMVRGDWVKPGAVVIDVGINRVEDKTAPKGSRLVGDVAFDEVKEVAGAITPVPGGVGPMTIAMLLRNTLTAAQLADKK